jgi:atrial natriuretic peptide clearance receptor
MRHSGGTRKHPEFTIAVLLPSENSFRFSQPKVLPAIHLAVEMLKNQSDIVSGFDLTVKHRDSRCDIAYSTNEAFNFYLHKHVDIFFGPCCDYSAAPVARQINFWEIPMLTAGALAGDFGYNKLDEYRLMTRIGANFNSLARFFTAAFKDVGWVKFKLLYDPFAQSDIVPRYCHLAADGLHQYIQKRSDITHDYFKFLKWQQVSEALHTELGKEYASKSFYFRIICISMYQYHVHESVYSRI